MSKTKLPSAGAKRPASLRTAFVPRSIFRTVFQGVVPVIAATSGVAGCGPGVIVLAVVGFDGEAGRGDATDTRPPSDMPFGVADRGFTVADAGFDVPPPRDNPIIVLAMIGFEVDPGAAPSERQLAQSAPGTNGLARPAAARRTRRNARA